MSLLRMPGVQRDGHLVPVRGRRQHWPGRRAAQGPGHPADADRSRLEHHLPQQQAPRGADHPQVLLQLLHRLRRLPRVVIPAVRGDIRAGRVAEVRQVVIELGHILAGGPHTQGPPVRHAAVQQHHGRTVIDLVQRLALAEHLPGPRQPRQRPAALSSDRAGPGVPERRAFRRGCREVLPGHHGRGRRGCPRPGPARGSRGKHPGPPPGHRPGRQHHHDAQGHPAATAARSLPLRVRPGFRLRVGGTTAHMVISHRTRCCGGVRPG